MGFNFILPLRIAQTVLAVIVLGTAAYYTNFTRFLSQAGGPFLVFCSCWTFLALGYLVAAPLWVPSIHNMWAVLGVEAVTMLFWFIGFIVCAANLANTYCDDGYYLHNNCSGLGSGKAATAFGAFEWMVFVASLTLCIIEIVKHRKGGHGGGGGEEMGGYQQGYPQQGGYPQQPQEQYAQQQQPMQQPMPGQVYQQ